MKKLLSLALVLALCLMSMGVVAETADQTAPLVILHTNDIHGHAMATDDEFGYARIAMLKKGLQNRGYSVLLLDGGDYSQGTPLVNMSYGKASIDFMNVAGYDAATIGNHEFDWGLDNLLENTQGASFAVLCANITRTAGGDFVFAPNKIFDMPNGMKVGVFGLATPETMTKAHPDKVKGIAFSMDEALYADAQAQVDELKAAGCDMVVCLAHLGQDAESEPNRSIDLLEVVTGIDLFIDAHSHTVIDGGEMDGETLRVSTGCYFENIGYVVVNLDKSAETPALSMNAGLFTHADNAEAALVLGADLTVDEEIDAVVTAINNQVDAQLGAAFAVTEVVLHGEKAPGVRTQETNLGDFAADAILWAAKQALGEDKVQAALTNGGGIRASIDAGDVTMKDMKTVFPFGNEVAVVTITGAELLEALEAATYTTPEAIGAFPQVSGIEFTIDTTVEWVPGEAYDNSTYFRPANLGSRVTIATVGGEPFDPEKLYTIATNDFTAAGGDTYGVLAYPYQQTGYKTGVALEDALINYTATVLGGVIGAEYAEPQGRITIK